MNKIKLSRGQKIKCKATQHQKYKYGIENISNDKQYEMDGDVVVGFGTSSSGSMVTTVSTTDNKTGWLCDDGITYWK